MAPQPVTALRHHHEYAAKVVCGVVKEEKGPLNVGRYFTAVNVHNPSTKEARLCVKLAIASPGHGGNITKFHSFDLKPDQALELDCEFVRKLADGADFVKGFLVIKCVGELDVVAVYTAGALEGGRVAAMHTERVPMRSIVGGFEC
ncbi:MAG: hypothetical protein KC486_03480 [Myxococcales bacterium]|nr:hypothetical protein [Myxococcales bacterium]